MKLLTFSALERARHIRSDAEGSANWQWSGIYYLAIAVMFTLIGMNKTIDLVVLSISIVTMALGLRYSLFIPLYFAIVLFEPVLVLPVAGASYFRIYQALFLLFLVLGDKSRRLLTLSENDVNREALHVSYLGMVVFLLFSVLYVTGIVSFVSYLINFIILGYINDKITRNKSNYEIILSVIIVFSVFSGLYGIIHDRYALFEYGKRYVGTYSDPNYSAMFYTLGILACLGKSRLSKLWRVLAVVFLSFCLLRSNSLTSYFGLIIMLLIYALFVKPRVGLVIVAIAAVVIGALMILPLQEGTFIYGLQYRIQGVKHLSISKITSGRTDIFGQYMEAFKKLPLMNQLFGGLNPLEGSFRATMLKQVRFVSHSIIIDLLFTVGVFGTFVLCVSFAVMLVVPILRFKHHRDNNSVVSLLFKCCVLYYSLFLSIYPFRNFYSFMFLL